MSQEIQLKAKWLGTQIGGRAIDNLLVVSSMVFLRLYYRVNHLSSKGQYSCLASLSCSVVSNY